MIFADNTSHDVGTNGGGVRPPCTGVTPDALPDGRKPLKAKDLQTGVSTHYTQSATTGKAIDESQDKQKHWYALRVTYGREKKAFDYLVEKDVEAFYPTITTMKLVGGKKKLIEESRLPNIFFARGTEKELEAFVFDNVNLPFLRFYYRHYHKGKRIHREPLIVPDKQIDGLKKICESESENIILKEGEIKKFKTGPNVRIIDGLFKGVEGKVARYHGQQRVAVIIDGVLTACTAYIPSAFLKHINENVT